MLAPIELVWLLAATAKGDAAAFERLYAATRAKLYGASLRILRRADLAEEVLQESYVTVWRTAGEFNPRRTSPIAWMVAIARSHAFDLLRRRPELSAADGPKPTEAAAETAAPAAASAASDELRKLLGCMAALTDEDRRLILLAYHNGWSCEQLAERFAQPAASIRTALRRSLLQIRECMGA